MFALLYLEITQSVFVAEFVRDQFSIAFPRFLNCQLPESFSPEIIPNDSKERNIKGKHYINITNNFKVTVLISGVSSYEE